MEPISELPLEVVTITLRKLSICLATCLATLEKEIHCKFQKSCYSLSSRDAIGNCSKTVHVTLLRAIFATPKNRETSSKEDMLHASTCLATPLQDRFAKEKSTV